MGDCDCLVEEPDVCQAKTCPKYEEDLKECDCNDGLHAQGAEAIDFLGENEGDDDLIEKA